MTTRDPTIEDLLARLVSYDTTSRNSNLPLIDWVEQWLSDYGVHGERVYDESGQKANFFATIGPAGVPGYVLSGHTDTVPVDGQDWHTNPYEMVRKEGRLYGRGTVDMKGFLACCLSRVPDMVRADLKAPIHLAFSYDEEVGCQGVPRLLQVLRDRPVKPRACFVGEPSSMEVVVAHKAKQSYRADFTGLACHSSQAPHGVNAISYAARLVQHLDALAQKLAEGPSGELYDVPVSTAHVGVMRGGAALNIVPERCTVDFEFRVLPSEDIDAIAAEVADYLATLDAEMKARYEECGVKLSQLSAFPGLDTSPEAEVVRLACELANAPDYRKVAYGTEAGLFSQTLGVPTVVLGPGSIDQAHKPNEFVAVDQLERCGQFLDRLLVHCSR
ncbi:MAG: acetylornithine deacetylase [Natronospirillum sp.]|uniref:acetylornithine deacetylase n=1 Tax=Natronospirillum sp. TaxID=2812955 RepID=UPI0025D45CDB|nr:acetylornithine deacetylase [Natronospirillum sp.]MCH8551315.1 acetylornithine deacetylase [Natronospirillum sp.]